MKTKDIFRMCLQNLKRRKGRTVLTVSGVVIGCCSIIIMISIGIGMKASQDAMLSQMGDLTTITVMPSPDRGKDKTKLDKSAVAEMERLDYVKLAAPKEVLSLDELKLACGQKFRFQANGVSIIGIPDEAFEKLGYTRLEGEFPKGKRFEVMVGENFAFQFMDTKRPEGKNMVDYWGDPEAKPYFNPFKEKVQIVHGLQQAENGFGGGGEEGEGKGKKNQEKTLAELSIVGKLKEDYSKGDETSTGMVMSLRDLQAIQKEIQKVTGKKPNQEFSQVVVQVEDISQVSEVEARIKEMGFVTNSMETIREPMEKEARQKQMMLGGLGAISLFVAAIGIANTMIMSITERTREIGIMKSLGCYVRDIRKEFLVEAGMIGLLGGVVGSIVSEGISIVMNIYSSAGMNISIIPIWLIGFAIVFSIFMGVAAGYYPANKAVRISALEAMKY